MVQISPRPGFTVADITDAGLGSFGARVHARGVSVLDAWVPVSQVHAIADNLWVIGWISAAVVPASDTGPHLSQGADVMDVPAFGCPNNRGRGVHVAVLDVGFKGWGAAKAAGELPNTSGTAPEGSSKHGTACAEIIADLAPGATIHPVNAGTRAETEQFIKDVLVGSEITVISRSLTSTGGGFGGADGPWCDVARRARAAGALWINSTGNHGDGVHYRGLFTDDDGDGWHEFAAGDEHNDFSVPASTAQIRLALDWDAYPLTDQNYDLFLFRHDGTTWEEVDRSTNAQTGSQPPEEMIVLVDPLPGTYAFAVYTEQPGAAPMPLRALLLHPGSTLQHHQKEQSVNTVAACPEVLAVGAVPHSRYEEGPPTPSSSQGPTWDGRVKPDLVAPTDVDTYSFATFGGTSAATPHVAAAVALYVEATGLSSLEAADLLLTDVIAMGDTSPNNVYGAGRVRLDSSRTERPCEPGTRDSPCVTPCGSTGSRDCSDTCQWERCDPPPERCNAKDDDCDGSIDEDGVCPELRSNDEDSGCSCEVASGEAAAPLLPWLFLYLGRCAARRRPGGRGLRRADAQVVEVYVERASSSGLHLGAGLPAHGFGGRSRPRDACSCPIGVDSWMDADPPIESEIPIQRRGRRVS